MGDPWGVCVVPAFDDPGGLLVNGPLGHRVPLVSRWDPDANNYGWQPFRCRNVRALPLWWGGALVPEGWDRARRAIAAQGWRSFDALPTRAWCMSPAHPLDVLLLAGDLVTRGLASRIVLLDLVDGRLVERAQ